jgi:hypothetical protein
MRGRADPYAGPAPQPPPYPSRSGRNLLSAVVLAMVFGYAAQVVELRPLELLRDIGNIGLPIRPINFHYPEFQAVGREKYPSPALAGFLPATLTKVSADAGFPLRRHAV